MGTSIRVSMPAHVFTGTYAERAFQELSLVDRTLTAHNEDSELMQFNAQAGSWYAAGPALLTVASAAVRLGHLSEGALDVTVLPAMRRFGFLPGISPSDAGIDFTQLETMDGSVRLSSASAGVDFGGIAKGFGVDEAVRALKAQGVTSGLVDAGGDLYAMGRPEQDRPWTVGIRHPERADELVATLQVEDSAVATSGTYMQQRTVDGQTVSHLMDPRTGRPVHHVVSATIVAPDAMTADALATATSVLPIAASVELVRRLPGVEGFWILENGSHTVSPGLKNTLRIL